MKSLFKDIIVSIISWEAKLVLKKYRPRVIAVTGSVGKTSAKDAIYSVISKKYHARKSQKSFNSEVGVPLTVLGLPNAWSSPLRWVGNILKGLLLIAWRHDYPQWLVLEVGADKPGDIKQVAQWLSTDIVVMTHIGTVPVHVEFFESIEHLIDEKRSLAGSLKKDGLLLVDADDPASLNTRDRLLDGQKCITYARDNASDVNAGTTRTLYEDGLPIGTAFDLFHGDKKMLIAVGDVLGGHVVYPALAAYAIGNHLGVSDKDIVEALGEHESPRGRMRLIQGIRGSAIIDDTYNASPAALHEALATLERVKTRGKKIAILGDMLELGDYSLEEHKKAGARAATSADFLVTVGMRARAMADGALNAGMDEACIFQYETSKEAGKFVESLLAEGRGDIVLAKGSQSMRMERAVLELMAHPENAEHLLVRQDPEWLAKK